MQSEFSSLTNFQWEIIKPLLKNNKPRTINLRFVVDGIRWLCRTGCQWRNLEGKFPKWQSVYYYYQKWTKDGTISLIMNRLVKAERLAKGLSETPSLLAVDSQSVKVFLMASRRRRLK